MTMIPPPRSGRGEGRHAYSSFQDIADSILNAALHDAGSTLLVGIDGAGGSGKSALAERLAASFTSATVVHIDDFADWSDDSNWTMSIFAERVLKPLIDGLTSMHQRYDWSTDLLGEWFEVVPGDIVIVEGVSALRSDLSKYWTVSVWVDCPRDLRLKRGVERDGEANRYKWEDLWMPGEDKYMRDNRPWKHVDFIFDGTGRTGSKFSPPV